MTNESDQTSEIPGWMLGEEVVEVDLPPRDTPPPRSLHDLPIFRRFWEADAAEIDR